ncbi:MAG: hypothetical protein GXP40_03385, partial [Chloroflexi bacterium]|nr:hypothetical protein [Chloroflexota bacterium]
MRAIRRLYFYAVAFISLEVVLWGLIGLARTTFSSSTVGGVDQLAQALALILVGVPVFGIHWWAAQRSAHQDEEEHASGVRTVFLYAVLLALLIPVVQNGLAFLDRLLLDAFGLSASRAMLGGSQTLSDNLLAAVMNGILAAYFVYVLRDDWATVRQRGTLGTVRRLYRYIWVVYSLLMAVGGVQQMLRYLLSLPAAALSDFGDYAWFVNGLALILVGVPLWVAAWKTVQDSLVEAEERASLLRLGVLYVLSLSGVVFVLSVAGVVIDALLRMILGEFGTFRALMREIGGPLSMGIPLGGVWAYYGHWLKRDMDAVPDAPRRAGIRRLYYYILSVIGLAATFIGVTMLLSFTIDAVLG